MNETTALCSDTPIEKKVYSVGDIINLRNNGSYIESLHTYKSDGDQILEVEVKSIKNVRMVIE